MDKPYGLDCLGWDYEADYYATKVIDPFDSATFDRKSEMDVGEILHSGSFAR